jgi:hypothetical protein
VSDKVHCNSGFIKKGGFRFPLLQKPSLILKLLTGSDISIVEYDSPSIDIDIIFDFHSPIPLGPSIAFSGWIKLHGGVTIGYNPTAYACQ